MAKKRKHVTKIFAQTVPEEEQSPPIISTTVDKDINFKPLRTRLAEINQLEGVTGYIIRNSTSAAIDLKEASNLVPFALLSAHTVDACQELSEVFSLGHVSQTLIEGKNGKVLCVSIGENTISVFMEKDMDHARIMNELLAGFEL
jgi:predicted regulator of Ras-like GTPase activity (Roadblock/LC7/MglB family)